MSKYLIESVAKFDVFLIIVSIILSTQVYIYISLFIFIYISYIINSYLDKCKICKKKIIILKFNTISCTNLKLFLLNYYNSSLEFIDYIKCLKFITIKYLPKFR